MGRSLLLLQPAVLVHATLVTLLALTLTLAIHSHLSSSPVIVTVQTVLSTFRRVELDGEVLSFLLHHKLLLLSLAWCTLVASAAYISTRRRPILLLDYACFKPDYDRKLSLEACQYFCSRSCRFSPESLNFKTAIYLRSGLGNEPYGPPFIFENNSSEAKLKSAIDEAEEGMFSSVKILLKKTRISPSQIDILVVTCGMFSPSPSLSARLVNRFNFNPSIKTFNLSAMGCSAGTTATDMAARILRSSRKTRYALVVITENISLNWYFGDDRSMLVTNCLFRVGTAAVLITNDPARRGEAKMELLQSLVTYHGDDASYGVVMQQEDATGALGCSLQRDLVQVAGGRLQDHIRLLAPKVLPLTEIVSYCYAILKVRLAALRSNVPHGKKTKEPMIVPDFTTAFEHMCVHAGGRAVVDGVVKTMRLPEAALEPARMTLHRFGNSSGPMVFYELAYFDAKGRVRKGDRMWMVAFGAGFIVSSLVWKALQDSEKDYYNPWNDCLYCYPVKC